MARHLALTSKHQRLMEALRRDYYQYRDFLGLHEWIKGAGRHRA
jgi:hypothetical protein